MEMVRVKDRKGCRIEALHQIALLIGSMLSEPGMGMVCGLMVVEHLSFSDTPHTLINKHVIT
jgi:hypothetical protein